ncbi:PH domain-containing protein [Candidatus Latescibacterota bacterium]
MDSIIFTCSRDRFTNIITYGVLLILLMVGVSLYYTIRNSGVPVFVHLIIPISIIPLLAVFLYVPLKYTLTPDKVIINRLGPDKIIARSEIKSVSILDNNMLKGSLKLFANGGMGGYVGLYSNKALGQYKAHATRRNNYVLLESETEKYIITPDDPKRFVETYNQTNN